MNNDSMGQLVSQKNIKRLVASVVSLVILLSVYFAWSRAHPVVTIQTDTTPVTVQIGDKKITVTKNSQKVRLSRASYTYKAMRGEGKDTVKLYGTVDTIEDPPYVISLNYRLYSKQAIISAFCSAVIQPTDTCGYTEQTVKSVTYLADHTWALATLNIPGGDDDNSPTLSTTILALHLVNNQWEVAAGPVNNVSDLVGDVPDDVLGGYTQ